MMKYYAPQFKQPAFNCPFCQVLTSQHWSIKMISHCKETQANGVEKDSSYLLSGCYSAKCNHCNQISIWVDNKMVFPPTGNVEQANPDLPIDVLANYNEARDIVNLSPKGSVALLRLALQKLMKHIGQKGSNLNEDIADLVRQGLPIQLQQALDSVRVIGNHAVHPGQIDLNDTPETAIALFSFINIICEYFITNPKKIAEVFGSLPDKDKQNIQKRDL